MRRYQETKAWNKRTRWLTLLAVVLLFMLSLTACEPQTAGGGDASSSEESSSLASETTATTAESQPQRANPAVEDTSSVTDPADGPADEAAPSTGETADVNESPEVEGAVNVPAIEADLESLPRLIDLGAGKCIPCKEMAPILEELAETKREYFEVVFFDVWENPDIAGQYGVRIIPTQIFDSADGTELYRHIGFYSRQQILDKWRSLGIDVGE